MAHSDILIVWDGLAMKMTKKSGIFFLNDKSDKMPWAHDTLYKCVLENIPIFKCFWLTSKVFKKSFHILSKNVFIEWQPHVNLLDDFIQVFFYFILFHFSFFFFESNNTRFHIIFIIGEFTTHTMNMIVSKNDIWNPTGTIILSTLRGPYILL